MIDPIFQTDNYQLARKLLDAATVRHEAIATNVANAETPGFRRLDLAPDFAAQLKARLAAGD
ncbi:MAG: flagellar basal body rod protein FlgB, partial [Opitutaceae bacterium]